VLDVDFIAEHTDGYGAFEAAVRGFEWPEIERCSGLKREESRLPTCMRTQGP